jgi:hypothetical protein
MPRHEDVLQHLDLGTRRRCSFALWPISPRGNSFGYPFGRRLDGALSLSGRKRLIPAGSQIPDVQHTARSYTKLSELSHVICVSTVNSATRVTYIQLAWPRKERKRSPEVHPRCLRCSGTALQQLPTEAESVNHNKEVQSSDVHGLSLRKEDQSAADSPQQLNCAHWRPKSWFVYTPPACSRT